MTPDEHVAYEQRVRVWLREFDRLRQRLEERIQPKPEPPPPPPSDPDVLPLTIYDARFLRAIGVDPEDE